MSIDKAESKTTASTTGESTTAEGTTTEQIIEQMGGASGLVLSTVPVIALVVAHMFLPLMPTLAVALGAGAVLFVIRLGRGEKVPSAIGSLLGVALAAAIVIWTGSVRDFVVIGIWAALAIFRPPAISVVARRPLTGMIWNAVHGGEHAWREDRPTYRAHVIAILLTKQRHGSLCLRLFKWNMSMLLYRVILSNFGCNPSLHLPYLFLGQFLKVREVEPQQLG